MQSPSAAKIVVAVSTLEPALEMQAEELAAQLHLPFVFSANPACDYLLILTHHYLGLQKVGEKYSPVYVDFLSAKMQRRQQQATTRQETVARAFGMKKNHPITIIDATAGLGRDSFMLATLGAQVVLLERSPIISALLQNGIQRAMQHPAWMPVMQRMQLISTDAISWLTQQTISPKFIYLDPMFPERKKSALVKKEMLFFQDIVGEDPDAETLFQTALACAEKRVVVKRPRLAESLMQRAPDFSLMGKSSRFDVYLTGTP